MALAPSAATGATGLERLLLIFLMKTWKITECNEQHFLQRRSIQRSIGQNFTKLRKKPQEHSEPSQKPATPPETTASPSKNQNEPKNSDLTEQISRRQQKTSPHRTKIQTNGGKREITEQNLDEQRTMVAPAHNHTENCENFQELTLWMGIGFTRPHSGRLMILPVDQNVGAMPRQTWIDVCAASTSVLRHDPPQEPAKEPVSYTHLTLPTNREV